VPTSAQITQLRRPGNTGGVTMLFGREVGNDNGVVAARFDSFVVEVVYALDGPVAGDPDGVKAPAGSR
jgi:hypothetical protein